jgi:hypothetical protein
LGDKLKLDYYYGIEAEQFAFYRVPRLLIKDDRFKKLSSDAKLLYGLMLDRMTLSMKNGWMDNQNRAYIIYTVDNIMDDLGCSKPTCTKIIRELDTEYGIGLIEKKRRGLGKPDIIYVKNFATLQEKEVGNTNGENECPAEVKEFDFKKKRNLTSESKANELQEAKNADLMGERTPTYRSKEIEPLEVNKSAPNYNNNNNTDFNYNNINHINPISQKEPEPDAMMDKMDGMDNTVQTNNESKMDDTRAYMELIKDNIDYEHHMKYDEWGDRGLFDELYSVICDIVCVRRLTVRVGREDYPYELVKSRFLKLNGDHLLYVIKCMKDRSTKVINLKQYMITALYNAPNTINHYYEQEVRYDMQNGAWDEEYNSMEG